MAADNMRVTRSMAAAVRDASSPLKSGTEVKHEEQVNEGAQWLLTHQTLFHYSDVPVYEEGSHVVSDQPAEDEGGVIMLGGSSPACEQGEESDDAGPLVTNETMGMDRSSPALKHDDDRGGSEVSQSDASISSLGPYQDDTNATLVWFKEDGNWSMRMDVETKLRTRVRSLEMEYTRLKDSRETAMRSFAEKYEEAKSNELELAALMEENADLTMSLGFQQKVEIDLTNTLESLWTAFPKLPVRKTVRLCQGKELGDLKEQILAFEGMVADLQAENKELKGIIQQHDRRSEIGGEVDSNKAALQETRVAELEEENTGLRVKLIDALEKLVATQEQTAKRIPLGDENGNKRVATGDEPVPKKPKLHTNKQLPILRFLQPSSMSSNRRYRCLVPTKVVSTGQEAGFQYVSGESLLTWNLRGTINSVLSQLDHIGTIHGRYAWQSAAALEENCAFCRLISRRECEWYEEGRACVRCTRHHRPCIVVHRYEGVEVAVLLPLPIEHRLGLLPGEPGFWIRR